MRKFYEGNLADNFRHVERFYPVREIHRSGSIFVFAEEPRELPPTYSYQGVAFDLEQFLKRTETTGLLALKDDTILVERYWQGYTKESRATSFSVAKSFTSALIGITIEEGLIGGIDEAVTNYVPELMGSGYEGVRHTRTYPLPHVIMNHTTWMPPDVLEDWKHNTSKDKLHVQGK